MCPSNRRANILISVLWVIVVLAILVLALNFEARSDINRTVSLRDRARAYWLARAAVERVKYDYAISRMEAQGEGERVYRFNYTFDDGRAECMLLSNTSKMAINTTDRDLWDQLFTYFGLDDYQREEVVDAILDWRDEDDLVRLNGAEADHYQSLDPPYSPRNGPFQSLEELTLVRGITEEMFYGSFRGGSAKPGLKDLLTVSGPIVNRFDINSCPKGILMAMLELEEADADALVQARDEKPFDNLDDVGNAVALPDQEKLTRFFMTHQGTQFTIKATGFVYNSPARYTVEDEVRYTGGNKVYIHLAHKDFSLDHVDGFIPGQEEEP